jgi:chromosome transmission fidelity protein 4
MFAAIVEAGKLERALDLVERLHLEKSFELAMTIADNHRKLVDFIEGIKDRRFPQEEMSYTSEDGEADTRHDFGSHIERPRISPDNSSLQKRTLNDAEVRQVRPKQSLN